jgi:hypothetical protein
MTTHTNRTLVPASTSAWGKLPTITQAELAVLQELKRQKIELEERLSHLQDEIRNKLRYNVRIEPGSLTAELSTWETRNFCYDKLVALIGEQATANLRDQIEPTVTTRLLIKESV